MTLKLSGSIGDFFAAFQQLPLTVILTRDCSQVASKPPHVSHVCLVGRLMVSPIPQNLIEGHRSQVERDWLKIERDDVCRRRKPFTREKGQQVIQGAGVAGRRVDMQP